MVNFKRTIVAMAAAAAILAPVSAQASIRDTVNDILDQVVAIANPGAVPRPESGIRAPRSSVRIPAESAFRSTMPEFNLPAIPAVAAAELPEPSVEIAAKKFFCAEYARVRSGMAFGDAKYWWGRAKNLYTRAKVPAENAVMVFKVTSRLKLGHVAVVTHVVSSREIRVDQANWQNHGEIDHATPIRDVSRKNDWSEVRVWDLKSGQYGRVYPVSGFILKDMVREARND